MNLSRRQLDALTLLVLAGKRGETAYGLETGLNTLRALVKRGLAEYRPTLGDGFFPRQCRFTITENGYAAIAAAKGEAE